MDTVERHRKYLFPWVKPYYTDPLVFEEGHGVWLRDAEGREYLDFYAGILTTSLGHCHPRVVSAVAEQIRRLGHTSTLYVTEPQIEVAETLARLSPGELRRSAFTNSGTEAIETAITAACLSTGRTEVVALRYGYSGRSALASNLTGQASWRPLSTQIVGIKHARAPYVYRSPLGNVSEDRGRARYGSHAGDGARREPRPEGTESPQGSRGKPRHHPSSGSGRGVRVGVAGGGSPIRFPDERQRIDQRRPLGTIRD